MKSLSLLPSNRCSLFGLFLLFFLCKANAHFEESDDAFCEFENGQTQILTDTVCENAFIVDVEQSLIDPNGALVQCPYYDVHFYLLDTISLTQNWFHLVSYTIGTPNNPASFVGNYSYDLTNIINSSLGNNNFNCDQTYNIKYVVGKYWDPSGFPTLQAIDTVHDIAQIYYKCKIVNQVSVLPSQIPIQTCGESITLSTNYSSNFNNEHTWHQGSPSGPVISNNTSVSVNNGGWYYVFVDNNNIACDSGRGITLIADSSFTTSISSSGPNTIDCINGSNFPTLSLNNASNFNNHSFQWYFTNDNNVTSPVPFASTNQYIVKYPGDFFLVTTNDSTGCIDTSNVITINTFYESEPFTLTLSGDTVYCQGDTIDNYLNIEPMFPLGISNKPPYWYFDVYNGSHYIGSSYNSNSFGGITSDGPHWAIITNPVGCVYFTDTVFINIDTLGIPDDSIEISMGLNPNDIYCIGSQLTITNYDFALFGGIDHNLYINGSYLGNIFQNSPDITFDLSSSGWNHIYIISNFQGVDCYDTLFDYKAYIMPDGCCNGLQDYTLLYGSLDPGTVYDEEYLVVENLTTAPGRQYDLSGGSFNFLGDAFRYQDAFGGQATGPNLMVANNAEIYAVGSSFNSFCDTMWGGILIKSGGILEFDNSSLYNSYYGILPDTNLLNTPGLYQNYYYNGGQNIFHNNYISVTYYSNSTFNGSNGYLRGDFSCDPETMQFPFDANSNDQQLSYSFKAMDIYQGNASSLKNLNKLFSNPGQVVQDYHSKVSDHIYGVYLNENAQFDTVGGFIINNPLVAGYFVNEKSNELIMGFDSVTLNTYQRNRTWQQIEEYSGNSGLNSKGYALYVKNRPISIYNSAFVGDEFSTQTGYLNDYTVGISSNSNLILDLSRIRGMDYGTRIRANQLDIDLSDDIISNNVYGLYLEEDVQVNLSMGCTQFIKHSNNSPTQYGIYVESGASILGDIGGNDPTNFQFPAGNGWPVDTIASSPPYPFTTGIPGQPDVSLWFAPENWYAIYDDNAVNENQVLNYKYWRYSHEFVGENLDFPSSDAVFPSTLIDDVTITPLPHDDSVCFNVPAIYWPQARTTSGVKSNIEKWYTISPNPSDEIVQINSDKKIIGLELSEQRGKVVMSEKLNTQRYNMNFSHLVSGLYVIRIWFADGESVTDKIIKE